MRAISRLIHANLSPTIQRTLRTELQMHLTEKGLARALYSNIMHYTETGLSVRFELTEDSLNLFVGCRFVSTGE